MVSRDKPICKRDLRRIIKRFLADKDRGISMALFADLAGVSLSILKMVFLYETEPMTEYVQRRVTKAYLEFRDGEVAIMQNRDNTKFVQYRKEAKPVIQKSTALQLVNGKITIKVGMKNASDYSELTLDEQFKRG
jgi:AraC-like DNA-binding protein